MSSSTRRTMIVPRPSGQTGLSAGLCTTHFRQRNDRTSYHAFGVASMLGNCRVPLMALSTPSWPLSTSTMATHARLVQITFTKRCAHCIRQYFLRLNQIHHQLFAQAAIPRTGVSDATVPASSPAVMQTSSPYLRSDSGSPVQTDNANNFAFQT